MVFVNHKSSIENDIGLAAVLILVSFLYQRFMTGKDEEEVQGESFN